jgi:predicted amidohydrolase YtcJ
VNAPAPSFAMLGAVRPACSNVRCGPGVLVDAGRVRAVGAPAEDADRSSTFYLRDEWVVVPAFRDPHLHLLGMAAAELSVDVRAERAPTLAAALAALREAAAAARPGTWVRAFGIDEMLIPDERLPSLRELDEAVGDHPLVARHRSGHGALLNTRASAALAGAGRGKLRPGVLLDQAVLPDPLLPVTRPDIEAALRDRSRRLAEAGVVAVGDATVANDVGRLELLCDFVRRGVIAQDVTFMPGIEHLPEMVEDGWSFDDRFGRLHVGHAKVLPQPDDDLAHLVAGARSAGWPVAVHVLDAAELDEALGALGGDRPGGLPPDRLEHVGLCLPEQLAAIAAAGVDVVSNPAFLAARAAKYIRALTPIERDWLYPVRSLRARGVRVAAASDGPVTDALPLDGVRAAVRRGAGGARFAPAEAVDAAAALAMVSEDAASVMDGGRGRIEVGAPADLVVLDRDLLAGGAGLDGLDGATVIGTFRAGVPLFVSDALLERAGNDRLAESALTRAPGGLLF